MSLRSKPGHAKPSYPPTDPPDGPLIHPYREARRPVLERAYPLAKQLAEVLELEAIEPWATSAKRIRQAVGVELAELGQADIARPFVTIPEGVADDDHDRW